MARGTIQTAGGGIYEESAWRDSVYEGGTVRLRDAPTWLGDLSVQRPHSLFDVVHAWEEEVVPLVRATHPRRYLAPEVLRYAWVSEILHGATRLSEEEVAPSVLIRRWHTA